MTVADYIAQFLVSRGVRHIFGFQGSAMLKMLDAIMATGKIEYVQNFHEQASAFAADAYARISGGIGVAIATSGPGAANLVSGMANAYYDSVPVLFLTGQDYLRNVVNPHHARQNGFQDMDIVSMARPILKYSVRVDNPKDIRKELENAVAIATAGRMGPVLLDVPIDIQFATVEKDLLSSCETSDLKLCRGDAAELESALRLINLSNRPVILAGGGIRAARATGGLKEFSGKSGIPVVATLNGIDACDEIVGFSGLYGNTEANLALLNADLIIALGTRFALKQTGRERSKYAPDAKVIHVEIDPHEIDRSFMMADVAVHADVGMFLSWMNERIGSLAINPWRSRVGKWCSSYHDTVCFGDGKTDPVRFIRTLSEFLPEAGVVTADVGANQMWLAQAFRARGKQRLVNSAGHGAMGYSLPAAIGASYVCNGPIVAVMGDGGFQMNGQELNTLALRRNNVKCIVFNNNVLGLMRDTQLRYYRAHFYGNNPAEFSCPDLEGLAKAYHLPYARIATDGDLESLRSVFAERGPFIVDVRVSAEAQVLNRYDDEVLSNGYGLV